MSKGIDYADPSGLFTFNATFTSDHCVQFTPNDDDKLERDKTVTLHLSTNDSAVDIDGDQVVITITDDDSKMSMFCASSTYIILSYCRSGVSVCNTCRYLF